MELSPWLVFSFGFLAQALVILADTNVQDSMFQLLPFLLVVAVLICSFCCSSCLCVQLLDSTGLKIPGTKSHQTGWVLTHVEINGLG
jgi:hypothetical protein